jgi:hypothetical protein
MRMRIGEYGNRRRATLPYPVYVTNSKHWSPGVRDPEPEDADSCERPKARGNGKKPAIARRFAVVRWKLGRLVSLLQLRRTNQERFMADCEAIAMGDRTVPKAENYPCLQTKVSSTAKSPLL